MAYKDSGPLDINHDGYTLGNYWFSIRVTPDPGESTTGINVRCYNNKTGEMARVASEVTGTVQSWSVEANETEASVYVDTCFDEKGNLKHPIPTISGTAESVFSGTDEYTSTWNSESYVHYFATLAKGNLGAFAVAEKSFRIEAINTYKSGKTTRFTLIPQLKTINGKSCYIFDGTGYGNPPYISTNIPIVDGLPNDADFYSILYDTEQETLVARFAIDLREAGGGPGGDWDEPGNTGDPSYTLNVNVTGASAGTHDAAAAPVAPADQPIYGSGGAGGNGGGGGAGQSTVIVRRFATDKAGSINQEVTLRPPGVGGKGGPGGKGGDGCILIFY